MTPRPFVLEIPDAAIADLKTRLGLTRFPDAAPGDPWAYGSSVDYMRELVGYWKDRFDWRVQEAALNAFPQFKVPLHDIDLHYLHVPGKGPNPYPLLLLHGWPGSVYEFLDIIPRLTDPARFGGDPKDAFTVIAPSLPGYGLSFKPGQKRFILQDIAACVHDLMTKVLGFEKYAVQGGDWGGGIASIIGQKYTASVCGIHVNLLFAPRDPTAKGTTPEEDRYFETLRHWLKEETGYQQIQGTKPQTLAFALTDSPAGLAAWIAENSAPGRIATASRKMPSAGTACWRTSRSTGSPVRSGRRSGPITAASIRPGRSRRRSRSRHPPAMRPSRRKSSCRRARSRKKPTPTSSAGP